MSTATAVSSTAPNSVPLGLIPTPFLPHLEAVSRAKSWTNWAGYISPLVLDTMEFEYFESAIRRRFSTFRPCTNTGSAGQRRGRCWNG